MLPGPPRRRPARPVAEPSLQALSEEAEDLAKGWLLALVEQAPLEDAPRIMAADLHREGPRLCAAILAAIGSDSEQYRLEPGGDLAPLAGRAGELAGAGGPAAAAQAVDALQEVLWAALRRALSDPDPDLVAQLAQRLAQVAALVRTAVLEGAGPGPRAGLASAPGWVARPVPAGASEARSEEPHREEPRREEPRREEPRREEPSPEEPRPFDLRPQQARSEETRPRAWMDAASEHEPDSPPLWVGALGEEIGRAGSGRLSLLLAELEDADRVLAVESEGDSSVTFGAFAQGVRQAVRRQDILVCETTSRAWVIARDTGRSGAQALSERISSAVREGRPWRGAPMAASVGIAVLGEDGRSPAELIEAAEEDRFAASARGGL